MSLEKSAVKDPLHPTNKQEKRLVRNLPLLHPLHNQIIVRYLIAQMLLYVHNPLLLLFPLPLLHPLPLLPHPDPKPPLPHLPAYPHYLPLALPVPIKV